MTCIVCQVITDWQLGGHLDDTLVSYLQSGNVRWVPVVIPPPLGTHPDGRSPLELLGRTAQSSVWCGPAPAGERSGVDAGKELGEHVGVEAGREVALVVVAEVEGRTEEVVGSDEEVR